MYTITNAAFIIRGIRCRLPSAGLDSRRRSTDNTTTTTTATKKAVCPHFSPISRFRHRPHRSICPRGMQTLLLGPTRPTHSHHAMRNGNNNDTSMHCAPTEERARSSHAGMRLQQQQQQQRQRRTPRTRSREFMIKLSARARARASTGQMRANSSACARRPLWQPESVQKI